MTWLTNSWPWWIAGPLLGITVPLLLWVGNRQLGVSGSLRAVCAATIPCGIAHFTYDWKKAGMWNLVFVAGIATGGWITAHYFGIADAAVSARTRADLAVLGIHDTNGLVPRELFNWSTVMTLKGLGVLVGGGFMIGFGTAYGGGCTSGHGISGVANLDRASLLACATFFATGILVTLFLLPVIL